MDARSQTQLNQHLSAAGDAAASRRALIAAALVALAVISPFFFLGNASGHDFEVHAASWLEAAQQWRQGVIYPRWAEWANFGFGEPRFIFYPPLSWTLGAALEIVLPGRMVPGALIWLSLLLAGMSMYYLAREWLKPGDAMTAAAFYAANPYFLVIVYYRSDFAELLAAAFFPLAVLFVTRITRGGERAVARLAVAFALLWLSNAPTAVIATYSLVLVLVVVSLVERAPRALLRGAAGLAAGFGLAAFYILPAAWEQKWVRIDQVFGHLLLPEKNFLFTHSNDPEFVLFNWKVSSVAVGILLVAGIAAVIAGRQRKGAPGFWWTMTALGSAAAALMFPLTLPAWRYLPELRFVQFPWRWLIVLNLACAALLGRAIAHAKWKWAWRIFFVVLLIAAGAAMVRDQFAWSGSDDLQDLSDAIRAEKGYEGMDEYQPLGCDRTDLPAAAPRVRLQNDAGKLGVRAEHGIRIHVEEWSPERKVFSADTQRALTLELKLVNYPAWRAEVNGEAARLQGLPGTAQMLLEIPGGHNRVEIRFARTADRSLGNIFSLLTALALASCVWFGRRGRPEDQQSTASRFPFARSARH